MRYLFFDIECCDGKHICEFGFVITDENFQRIDKQVITINPDKPFCLTGRGNQADITLSYTEQEYYESPLFPDYYDIIKELLEYPDQVVFGYSIKNDILFLKTACERYQKQYINFQYIDVQIVYKLYSGSKDNISLEKAIHQLNITPVENLHRSDDDSYGTLEICKAIRPLKEDKVEIDSRYSSACGHSDDINRMYSGNDLTEMLNILKEDSTRLSNGKKKLCIKRFAEIASPVATIEINELSGTKICFSFEYELNHTKETIILIQLLAKFACRYTVKVSESDYYVATESELNGETESDIHTRYYAAAHERDGQKVKIITWLKLLDILGVTEETLDAMEMPKISPKYDGNTTQRNYDSAGNAFVSLGDILRSQGMELRRKD